MSQAYTPEQVESLVLAYLRREGPRCPMPECGGRLNFLDSAQFGITRVPYDVQCLACGADGAHDPEQPSEPAKWTAEQVKAIRTAYRKNDLARCPLDNVILHDGADLWCWWCGRSTPPEED